jgi:hypothetical protein
MPTPVQKISPILPPQGDLAVLGANWRLQFIQPDGLPLTMNSFEVIDFGAISYKEVFQNIKTILATPIFSCALERTLGVDQNIVDRPMNDASHVTVAILTAVVQWEPRAEIMNISFDTSDALNGHLIINLQLNIRNVIYRTNTVYPAKDIGQQPTQNVIQGLPPISATYIPVPGPQGDTGPQGQRGSLWFTGAGTPTTKAMVPMKPPAGAKGPTGEQGKRGFVWLQGAGDPVTPQANDMYLNTSNGDVWQFDGTTQTWRLTNKK